MRKFLSLTTVFCFIILMGCKEDNYVVNDTDLDSCTANFEEYIDSIDDKYLGIVAYNDANYIVGYSPAERYAYTNNWFPLSPYKQVVKGKFDRYGFYDGTGDEKDWNIFILPSNDFKFLIDDALVFKGGAGAFCFEDNWHTCDNQYCLEAEITPDGTFLTNPWFPPSANTPSLLEGMDICAYGPWVRECYHSNRPEIHPSELIWWRENWQGSDLYWMVAQLDDSGRFNDNGDFDLDEGQVDGWKPWSKAPLVAVFKIPFEVSVLNLGNRLSFQVGEAFGNNVVSGEDPQVFEDADNGTSHVLEYNGKELVTVIEIQEKDENIGVKFVDLCKSGNIIKGFVQLKTKIGVEATNTEGHQVLFCLKTDKPGLLDHLDNLNLEVEPVMLQVESDSTDFIIEGDSLNQGIYTTLKINALHTKKEGDLKIKVTRILADNKPISYEVDPVTNQINIFKVPIFLDREITIEYGDGSVNKINHEALQISTVVEKFQPVNRRSILASEGILIQQMDLDNSILIQDAQESIVKEIQLQMNAQYLPPKPEEVNIVGEQLMAILQDAQKSRSLFGSRQPITVDWELEAKDLLTGANVPATSQSLTSQPGVRFEFEDIYPVKNALLNLQFFNLDNTLVEVTAHCTIRDSFGNSSYKTFTLFNRNIEYRDLAAKISNLERQLPINFELLRDKEAIYKGEGSKQDRLNFQIVSYFRLALKDKNLNLDEIRTLNMALDSVRN